MDQSANEVGFQNNKAKQPGDLYDVITQCGVA